MQRETRENKNNKQIYIFVKFIFLMDFNEKDIKRLLIILIVVILAILAFLLIKPILLSAISGLIIAYVFSPVNNWMLKRVKRRTLSATIVTALVILIIVIPLWFLIPLMTEQVFRLFTASQNLDISGFLASIFPNAGQQFLNQMSITIQTGISNISSSILNSLVRYILKGPELLLNLFVAGFVFFFTLRDTEHLKRFVYEISPLTKSQEEKLVSQFKGITNSIVYGQVIVGVVQGVVAMIGFILFGIPNALVFGILAIVLSIIPLLGPFLIWGPLTLYLYSASGSTVGTIFLIYNIVIVSSVDNLLRVWIVSKRTEEHAAIVLLGMIGGMFLFGIVGLVLGPLILAYLLTFIKAYRDKILGGLFKE